MRRHITLLILAAACARKDATPPPAPFVEPVAARTTLAAAALRGTAEYNATIAITRSPAFASGEATTPATVAADSFTGAFAVSVPLAPGDNELDVTATDAAGNRSAATVVKIKRETLAPASVALSLDRATVSADDGTVSATAAISIPPGGALDGWEVDFSATPATGAAITAKANTDADGRARATLSGLTAAGDWTISATAKDVRPAGAAASDQRRLTVTGGKPWIAVLLLSAGAAPTTELTIAAGTAVTATVEAKDAAGNALTPAFTLSTTAPGATAAGNELLGANQAGAFTVVAALPGAAGDLSASAALKVTAAADAGVRLTLAASEVQSSAPLAFSVAAIDAFGNATGTALTFSAAAACVAGSGTICLTTTAPAGHATFDTSKPAVTFSSTGQFTLTANAGAGHGASATATVVDLLPPTGVAITAPAAGARYAPGATISVTVTAQDETSLADLQLQARGAFSYDAHAFVPTGSTTASQTFTLAVPNGAYGTLALVAAATDTSGNRAVGAEVDVTVDPLANVVAPGYTVAALAGPPQLVSPQGVAADGSGNVYVADRDLQQVVKISASGVASAFSARLLGSPAGIAFDSGSGALFVTIRRSNRSNGGQVIKLAANGVQAPFTVQGGGFDPRGVSVDGSTRRLVVADAGNDQLLLFNADATFPAQSLNTGAFAVNFPTNVGGNLGGVWGVVAVAGLGTVYATNEGSDDVWRENGGGTTRLAGSSAANAPRDAALAPSGKLYYANSGNGTIVQVANPDTCSGNGCAPTVIASGFDTPTGVAFDSMGRLVVADESYRVVARLTGSF